MDTLFGLPSHPLFVHLPVVVVPVAALAALAIALRPAWRRRFGPAVTALAAVGFAGTFMATRSGEELYDVLADRIGDLADDHQELGEQTFILVAVFFLSTVATVVADHRLSRVTEQPTWLRHAAAALAWVGAAVGAAAMVWMMRTGHEGARIVWEGVVPEQ